MSDKFGKGEDRPFKRVSCTGCVYHRQIGDPGSWGCHFMLDTGEKRGCPPTSCTRKVYMTPKRYRSELMLKAAAYFSSCRGRVVKDEDGNPVRGRDGRTCIEGEHPPTVSGLALALGFASRKELFSMREDEQVGDVVCWALGRCEADLEERLCETAAGVKLALQNNFPEWGEEKKDGEDKTTVVQVEIDE